MKEKGHKKIKWDTFRKQSFLMRQKSFTFLNAMHAKSEASHAGYIYTLEVLIVVSVIFVALVFVYRAPPPKPELELSILRQQGYEALEYLDSKADLRSLVNSNDEAGLESEIDAILAKSIKFETEVCTTNCSEANVPTNKPVVAIDYFMSGYKDVYSNRKVRLWLWGKY